MVGSFRLTEGLWDRGRVPQRHCSWVRSGQEVGRLVLSTLWVENSQQKRPVVRRGLPHLKF